MGCLSVERSRCSRSFQRKNALPKLTIFGDRLCRSALELRKTLTEEKRMSFFSVEKQQKSVNLNFTVSLLLLMRSLSSPSPAAKRPKYSGKNGHLTLP
jgi:hypothetical protein